MSAICYTFYGYAKGAYDDYPSSLRVTRGRMLIKCGFISFIEVSLLH